jgi:hypothetical protein
MLIQRSPAGHPQFASSPGKQVEAALGGGSSELGTSPAGDQRRHQGDG